MSLYYSAQEIDLLQKENKEVYAHSNFAFLNAHNGFRRGCMHILMGTTGSGKTTVVRTILRDMIFNKNNALSIGVWLSEESLKDYKTQLSYSMPSVDKLKMTVAFSEVENSINEDFFFTWIRAHSLDVLIIDNITTSQFYASGTTGQESFARKIKNITKELNIITILVAHTDAHFLDNGDKLITPNDIRGNKTVPNMAEFFYGMQRFSIGNDFFPTIRLLKYRNQNVENLAFYLHYQKDIRAFISDKPIDFNQLKEAYDNRNNLRSRPGVKK